MSEKVFESWASARAVGVKPLSEKSIHLYRARWLGFALWLADQGSSVALATPEMLRRYLESRSPRAKRVATPSPVTMSRYFSVIAQIYRHGLLMGMVPKNPAQDVVIPYKEAAQGVVLPHHWINAIRHNINYQPQDFKQTRDALVMHLCLNEGLSVAELCAIRIADVYTSYEGLPERRGDGLLASPHVQIRFHGPRKPQQRTRALQAQGAALMQLWLALLNTLVANAPTDFLLRSHPLKNALTPKTCYLVCAEHVRAGLLAQGITTMPYHIGPNALRNSCIVDWLNHGVPATEVCARVGLAGPSRLQRIAHAVIAD
jgi:integrase/recombinase XerC